MNQISKPKKDKAATVGKVQKGVTLVELLVSLAIASVIFVGVIQLYQTSTNNSISFEGAARIQENARYVFNQLERDIAQAGSSGCMNLNFALGFGGEDRQPRLQNLLANNVDAQGIFNVTTPLLATNNAGLNNSDTLVVRYANRGGRIPIQSFLSTDDFMQVDDSDPDYSRLDQFDTVYATNCNVAAVFMITNDVANSNGRIEFSAGVVSPEPDNQSNINGELPFDVISDDPNALGSEPGNLLGYVYAGNGGSAAVSYSIGNSAAGVCAARTPLNCALLRNGVPIVEGVQDFQVEFGWENAGGQLVFSAWDIPTSNNAIDIDRVRVSITFNSIDQAPTLDGQQFSSRQIARTFNVRNQIPLQ